jgi:sugar phosphate isomerase/epimerase
VTASGTEGLRLALAFAGRVPQEEAVERAARLDIGATVLWVDLTAGPAALASALTRARELDVALLGLNAYANLVHPDAETRRWNVGAARQAMRFAAESGAPWVNMMAGTREPAMSFWAYHPDNYSEATWADLLEGVRELLDSTPERVGLTLEPYMLTPLATTERLRRVLDDVASPRLNVVLDPVNLVEPREYHRSAAVVGEMFAALGGRIVAVHAKDHYMHRQKATVQIDERVPGQGDFPYDALLRAMDALESRPALVIEHLSDDGQIAAARDFIRRTAEKTGVTLR